MSSFTDMYLKFKNQRGYHTDNCFFKYNIILQCIYTICKCEELFFKNKFGDIFSELQCCILFIYLFIYLFTDLPIQKHYKDITRTLQRHYKTLQRHYKLT